MGSRKLVSVITTAALALAAAAPVEAQQAAGVFSKGRAHFFVTGGAGSAFDESYFVLGAGLTYYLFNGLGLGLGFESWSGADPGITKVTASAQYVFYQPQTVKPYAGGFYRRTYVDGLPDLNSLGARGGVYFQTGRNAYLGIGAVYETYQDCEESRYRKCDSTYPEVSFTVAF